MKRKVYVLVLLVMTVVACSRKSLPVITERKTEKPVPEKPATDIKPDLAAGMRIFVNRCGNCHDLPKPEAYTAERWGKIMLTMGPKARLSTEQDLHVQAYLKANAAK